MADTDEGMIVHRTARNVGQYALLVLAATVLVATWVTALASGGAPMAPTPGEAVGLSAGPAVLGSLVLVVSGWRSDRLPDLLRGLAVAWAGYLVFVLAYVVGGGPRILAPAGVLGASVMAVGAVRLVRARPRAGA
ncbi:hypothetical protein JQN72_03895 [Phycicoccus sp. CSK15P-2]|uniref:hypothetical protein n=1 Tax=Phycicoccus sp. CSK15P-2 TaxID=2807627 RepID=UPI00194F9EA9|nr:hypothetical protein [Phycicoccus sp. CSK15P-2]MBM6403384.1 hypothetical protein [Phycicoccus sp. CSK15P-2]